MLDHVGSTCAGAPWPIHLIGAPGRPNAAGERSTELPPVMARSGDGSRRLMCQRVCYRVPPKAGSQDVSGYLSVQDVGGPVGAW